MYSLLVLSTLAFGAKGMSNFYFQDANGVSAEILLSFSDLTMVLILPISTLVILLVLTKFLVLPTHRYLVDSQFLEFSWSAIPAFLLILLVMPSFCLLYTIDEVGIPLCTNKVQGHQWYWGYECSDLVVRPYISLSYLNEGYPRLLDTDYSLVLYPGLVSRFLITSADVLHSWSVPSFGFKADAVPGRVNQLVTVLDRPGVTYGQCSEICGSNHSFIPIIVNVLSKPQRVQF